MLTIKHISATLTREEKDTLLAAARICEELDDLFGDRYDIDFDEIKCALKNLVYQETFTISEEG